MGRKFFCVQEWFIAAVYDRSLVELIGMQQNRNNNRKYTVKFFNSADFKEEILVAVFCCLFA